jgi:hypothetical protein
MTGARRPTPGRSRWPAAARFALGSGLALTAACVTPPDDAHTHNEDARAAPAEPDLAYEEAVAPASAADAPAADAPSPGFDEIQRALAANNAKLRALGVRVPTVEQAEGAVRDKPKDTATGAGPATERKPAAPSGGAAGGSGTSTSSQSKSVPGASPPAEPRRDKKDDSAKRKSGEPKGSLADSDDAEAPAKATPIGRTDPNLDAAAGRCQQICDLSGISCGLGEQICELAERHPEEDDYVAACERAIEDCDAAKEACDVCVE